MSFVNNTLNTSSEETNFHHHHSLFPYIENVCYLWMANYELLAIMLLFQ